VYALFSHEKGKRSPTSRPTRQDQTAKTKKQKQVAFDLPNSKNFEQGSPPEVIAAGPHI
jgi:hypothetical protein